MEMMHDPKADFYVTMDNNNPAKVDTQIGFRYKLAPARVINCLLVSIMA